ncbi:hypothetical protein GJAV_G00220500 [Gymnothorax javanicus]|nr:hypothetical protein GJAV_G00220500 [Gymnothorax javanicus]
MRRALLPILGFSFILMADLAPSDLAPSDCKLGYGRNKTYCYDLDECADKEQPVCGQNAICTNTNGSYYCNCQHGYRTRSQSINFTREYCRDINECKRDRLICGEGGDCHNTAGSYKCICKPGFSNYGIDQAKCVKLPCNHFDAVGSLVQLPEELEKALSFMRNSCNALSNSNVQEGGQPSGEKMLERLLPIIDELQSGGALKNSRMVTVFFKVVEDALRLFGPLLPNNTTRKSSEHTEVQFLVKRGEQLPKGEIHLSSQHVQLDTHWETAAGDATFPGFAAASLMMYKGLESSTNDSFHELSTKRKNETFLMNSKVVTVSVSNLNTGVLQKKMPPSISHTFSPLQKSTFVFIGILRAVLEGAGPIWAAV